MSIAGLATELGDRSRVHLSLDLPSEGPAAAAAAAPAPASDPLQMLVPAPDADLIAAMEAAALEAGGVQGALPLLAVSLHPPTSASLESNAAGTDAPPSTLAPIIAQHHLLGAPPGEAPVLGPLLAGQPLRISFSRPSQAPAAPDGAAEGGDIAARGGEVAARVPASVSAPVLADGVPDGVPASVPAEASPKLPVADAQQPSARLHRLPSPLWEAISVISLP